MNKRLLEQISKLLVEAEGLYEKAEKRLLKIEVLDSFKDSFWELLSANKSKLDEESQLEFERDFEIRGTKWTVIGENFLHNEKALRSIKPRKEYLEKVLARSEVKLPSKSMYLRAGNPFTARRHLKKLLERANRKIILVDNFFHPDVLDVLEEVLSQSNNIEIYILRAIPRSTKDKILIRSLRKLSIAFNAQYGNPIKEVITSNSLPLHDRYIIIDDDKVYHSGHSFHGWGDKASRVSEVLEESEKEENKKDISLWRATGSSII